MKSILKTSMITSSIILALSTSLPLLANTISGTVKDETGQLVTSGYVQIMGTNKRTPINENGEFKFTSVKPGKFELHVSSVDHIHSSQNVSVVGESPVKIIIEVAASSIEVFDVTASAFHASNIESAAPVSILAGEKLQQQQASTLGETLKNLVGVHSTFYGGVTSAPIIRGLDGPRVLITQNGMDAADASRVGPDHLISTESSTVKQIEVLRGPATLFYGSGAIGGVVNMVDTRIPDDNLTEGQLVLSRNSNNAEHAFSGEYKTGTKNLAFQVLGFYRDNQDYRIPGFAESEEAHNEHENEGEAPEALSYGVVNNTAARTQGVTLGTSYLFDAGHVGMAVEHLSSVYGVPGHAHGAEHEENNEANLDEAIYEQAVKADLQQNRYQLAGKFQLSTSLISAVNFGLAYTDYQHTEIENGVPGTRFSNELFETRIEVLHQPISGWRGGVSLHTKMSDFAALGEEAFTPPSDTKSFGLGIIEERHFGPYLVQLGARIERVNIDVATVFSPELEQHGAEEGFVPDEVAIAPVSLNFTPVSLSAGVVWDIAKGYNLGASYVHAKRAPSSAELFSFGPHIGTQTYEVGALYRLHDEHFHFENIQPSMETSNNIDLSFRKFGGDFGAVFNIFYNQVDDYYYAANSGLFADVEHAHADEELGQVEEMDEEGLPIYTYLAANADLYGAEIQLTWNATRNLTFGAQGDYIRAKVSQGESQNLPRIPPIKALLSADYKTGDYTLSGQVTHMFKQTDVAEFEQATKGYTLVDINASYFTTMFNTETEWFMRGRNLFDEEARIHTSFLKNLAPLPGRSVEIGVRLNF